MHAVDQCYFDVGSLSGGYRYNLFLAEDGCSNALPASEPALAHRVMHILNVRRYDQVIRIDARRVVAPMTDLYVPNQSLRTMS